MLHHASNLGTARRATTRLSLLSPLQVIAHLSRLLGTWERRARERRMLAEMSPHMLKDLGITRSDASAESQKPFWRG
jgi:uncharacterized protein YjiS (DUF1127 family)